MGNNQSLSELTSGKYTSVNDLPSGMAPPSAPKIAEMAQDLAVKHFSYQNPTSVKTLRSGARVASENSTFTPQAIEMADTLRQLLSHYSEDAQPYADKIYQLSSPTSQKLSVWVSSNKNSDHTISYWLMYPVHDMHIRAAFLKIMNLDINAENLNDIVEKYPAVYKQVSLMLDKKTVKCEQIDPLYMNNVIKSLLMQNYRPQELKLK